MPEQDMTDEEREIDRTLRTHAAECSVCYQMMLSHDTFTAHTDDCAGCNLMNNSDYCPVGCSLQEVWLDDLYDENDKPRCEIGDDLMDQLLDC